LTIFQAAIGRFRSRLHSFLNLRMRVGFLFTTFLMLCFLGVLPGGEDYLSLHRQALVADGHNDTLLRMVEGFDLGKRHTIGHLDIPRMKEGGLDLAFFACFPSPQYTSKGAGDPDSCAWRVFGMIDSLRAVAHRYPQDIAIATTGRQVEEIVASGRIAAAIGVEGGHSIQNSLEILKDFYDAGVRYLTLTWITSNDWATSSNDESSGKPLKVRGLTPFGRQVVRRMNELGMMVDLSHVGEKTFWDVMEVTDKPVIASHSCAYALCPHPRNLKDDQIRAIAERRGVVLINFYAGYLDSTFEKKQDAVRQEHRAEFAALQAKFKTHSDEYWDEVRKTIGSEMEETRPPLDLLIDHIDHVVQLVGPDFVGIGSDFDGISFAPKDLEDVSCLPLITQKLVQRGYGAQDIQNILGGNFLRVFKEVTK